MNWLKFHNLQVVELSEIPRLSIEDLREQMICRVKEGLRVVNFFGDRHADRVLVYAILADDAHSKLFVASTVFDHTMSYPAITPEIPEMHLFEREVYEEYGIEPLGHPWLKPVRKGTAGVSSLEKTYPFYAVEGEEVHEVGVGPIHAGIIEPGYFKFCCHGETVLHLEIQHGFQHRGVEELLVKYGNKPQNMIRIAESIAGDTVVGHALACIAGLECLQGIKVSRRHLQIRAMALELERIATHLGDLSALAGDVAYLPGHAMFAALRTMVINTTMLLCGNRFGRTLLKIGGVSVDPLQSILEKISDNLKEVDERVELSCETMFSSASVLERFEKTGVINGDVARQWRFVGPAARASGLSVDVRSDHHFGAYSYFPVHAMTLKSGDVFARAYIKYIEMTQSIRIIRELFKSMPTPIPMPLSHSLKFHSFVVSMTEGWRGEIVHVMMTDSTGKIGRYKIKDPSFHNWTALALAVRGEGISDFPLCNKSFNLSYCGMDL